MSRSQFGDAAGGGLPPPPFADMWKRWEQRGLLTELLRPFHGLATGERLAGTLLDHFGSLPAALAAPTTRLMRVEGVDIKTATYLRLLLDASKHLAQRRIALDRPMLSSWSELLDYLHLVMAFEEVEQLRILFLDKKNRLIADEVPQTGTIDHTPVYPREILRRSFELGATALIVAHNHPSGEPMPSAADVSMTKVLAAAAEAVGITVHDHVVIARSGCTSLRGLGLL